MGERVFFPNLWEGLILRDWMGDQGPVSGLATEWNRIDERTIELTLREGIKFHNGDELTSDDVVFSFSDERLFASTEPVAGQTLYPEDFKPQTAKELPANVPRVARRIWPALRGVEAVDKYTVRFHNATPDVTMEGRLYAYGSQIATRAIDRQAIVDALWGGRTVVPAGMQFESYRVSDMFIEGWTVPEYNPEMARDLLKQSGYQDQVIPYRLLNNYYINQTATGQILTEMWRQVGPNVEIQMKENWAQIREDAEPKRGVRDWSASNSVNDPISPAVLQFGPNGQAQQNRDYWNDEMNQLSVLMETSTAMAARKKAFARMLEILEREDPAYTLLHQNAMFTGMKSSLNWKAAPAFAMDFRPSNWRG